MSRAGRPVKNINQKTFESLCGIQCTLEELCSVLDVSDKTLYKWCRNTYGKNFSEVYRQKRETGKASVRRAQFQLAQTNPTMSIWWGKQHLGQTDKMVQTVNVGGASIAEQLEKRYRQRQSAADSGLPESQPD